MDAFFQTKDVNDYIVSQSVFVLDRESRPTSYQIELHRPVKTNDYEDD